jgi:hypothetical protein
MRRSGTTFLSDDPAILALFSEAVAGLKLGDHTASRRLMAAVETIRGETPVVIGLDAGIPPAAAIRARLSDEVLARIHQRGGKMEADKATLARMFLERLDRAINLRTKYAADMMAEANALEKLKRVLARTGKRLLPWQVQALENLMAGAGGVPEALCGVATSFAEQVSASFAEQVSASAATGAGPRARSLPAPRPGRSQPKAPNGRTGKGKQARATAGAAKPG